MRRGRKPYYSDAFNVADVFLVVLSMALAILTISYDDDNVRKARTSPPV